MQHQDHFFKAPVRCIDRRRLAGPLGSSERPSGLSLRVEDSRTAGRLRRRSFQFRMVLAFSTLAIVIGTASAEVNVSFPTEGHYRPGRYLPVGIHGAAGQTSISLKAHGAIPTELKSIDSNDVMVPWLTVTDSISNAQFNSDGSSHAIDVDLHPLGSQEKLVAFAGPTGDASFLFPGSTIVPIHLDPANPLPDPLEAWDCLDGILLSSSAAARLSEEQRATLLAAGTALAVRSDSAPDGHWPWTHQGDYWVLRFAPAGPNSMVEPNAYVPTYGWDRGWPESFRRRVFFAAVLFSILALATLLWRSRWTILLFVSITAAFIVVIAIWYSRQSPVLQLTSAVRVDAGPISQLDLWTWESTVRPTSSVGIGRPVLGTLAQIEQTGLRLICRSDRRPGYFAFHLIPGQSMAFLTRQVRVALPLPTLSPSSRESLDFVNALYLRPSDRMLGQYSTHLGAEGEPFPMIVVRAAPQ